MRLSIFHRFAFLFFCLSFFGMTLSASSPPPKTSILHNFSPAVSASGASLTLSSPHYVLMEASTGTILLEKDATTALHPASITKIMTLLLIFDALDSGQISLEDQVTVSEYAASMGGSQVFLEPDETQTVQNMIKCICVSSANDACVAMAEHLCGSEEEFVNRMNERARGLSMDSTHFVNCCGLDTDSHLTSALDVARMSRELITKHPQIHDYSTIWMDTIIHSTRRGDSEFGLANTNKLLRQYSFATGLKTGSTNKAKFCLSATAEKNDIELIAVIMGSPDSKTRFSEAAKLLEYGYSLCQIYKDDSSMTQAPLEVENGTLDEVPIVYGCDFIYLDTTKSDLSAIKKEMVLPDKVSAPIKKGDSAGYILYSLNGKEIGRREILYDKEIKEAGFSDYFRRFFSVFCL